MTAVQVDYTKLFSEARTNVIALITASNVSDPGYSSAEFRKRIYSRDPDYKAMDFAGYPYIIVWPADVTVEKEKGQASLDGKSKFVFWDIEIEIVTSDRGFVNFIELLLKVIRLVLSIKVLIKLFDIVSI